jgi:hypothetical protein
MPRHSSQSSEAIFLAAAFELIGTELFFEDSELNRLFYGRYTVCPEVAHSPKALDVRCFNSSSFE